MLNVRFQSVVRVRPLLEKEIAAGDSVHVIPDASASKLSLSAPSDDAGGETRQTQDFYYDSVVTPNSTQEEVYEDVGAPLVKGALSEGAESGVLFSFGVSNSGKTYTLLGGEGENRGLLPRLIEGLFGDGNKNELRLSMLEIYNEQIYDLLVDSSKRGRRPALRVSQDGGMFHVNDKKIVVATSVEEALSVVMRGTSSTTTSTTNMNTASSRGHTVVTLEVPNGGSLMVVDMAGLERTKKSGVFGAGMRESSSINSSIMRVASVLKVLKWNSGGDGGRRKKLVPWRESKLTMLLQPVLSGGGTGGDRNVVMMISCYPGVKDMAEKIGLLKEVETLRGLQLTVEKMKAKAKGEGRVSLMSRTSSAHSSLTPKPKKRSGVGTPTRPPMPSAPPPPPPLPVEDQEKKMLLSKVEEMSAEIETVKTELVSAVESKEIAEGRVESMNNIVQALESRIDSLMEEVEERKMDIEMLEDERDAIRAEKEEMASDETEGEEMEAEEKSKDSNSSNAASSEIKPVPSPSEKKLSAAMASLASAIEDAAAARADLATAREDLKDKSSRIAALEDELKSSAALRIEAEGLRSDLEASRAETDRLRSELEYLRRESGNPHFAEAATKSAEIRREEEREAHRRRQELVASPLKEHIRAVEMSSANKKGFLKGFGGRGGPIRPFGLVVPDEWGKAGGRKRKSTGGDGGGGKRERANKPTAEGGEVEEDEWIPLGKENGGKTSNGDEAFTAEERRKLMEEEAANDILDLGMGTRLF